MRYKFLQCAGFEPSVYGMMLSYGKTSFDDFSASYSDVERLAAKLAPMDGGHNKFLEQIQYWILVQAPLFWWKQADTYRVGISKSSESTMHKSWKNGLTQEMFETPIFKDTLDRLNDSIREYNSELTKPDRKKYLESLIVGNLPDAYLQTRSLNVNAKCLRNMYFQRREHKLKQWRDFCAWIKFELPYGDLITAERKPPPLGTSVRLKTNFTVFPGSWKLKTSVCAKRWRFTQNLTETAFSFTGIWTAKP